VGFPDPRLENETGAGLHIIIKGAEREGEKEKNREREREGDRQRESETDKKHIL